MGYIISDMPKAYGQRCPMARSLEFLGERWTLLIIRDLLGGPKKFQDLETSLHPLTPSVLSQRLKVLEEHEIVTRRMYTEHPPRAEYALTARGMELRPVVSGLTIWGSRHLGSERVLVHAACGHPVDVTYHCPECDQVLPGREIRYVPSPRRQPAPKRRARRTDPEAPVDFVRKARR